MSGTLVWFRHDLRLEDNLALVRALSFEGEPVIPVYIWADKEEDDWPLGEASRWWLHQSLAALNQSLEQRGSRLIIRSGKALEELSKLIEETGASRLVFNRRYEPHILDRDKALCEALKARGIKVEHFPGHLLFEPWDIANKSGGPFQVFSAFWRHCLPKLSLRNTGALPTNFPPPSRWPESETLDSLGLLPSIPWDSGFYTHWTPGEQGAQQALAKFMNGAVVDYVPMRDRPDQRGVSRLSPHLHFGEITPFQIARAVLSSQEGFSQDKPALKSLETYLKEVGWREFAHHLLYHFPHTSHESLKKDFQSFPWGDNPTWLNAWQTGQTGYPIVDAGMRELWHTGWMHNRVRMIVASFLTKDLLLPWQAGAEWFWDTLVDADLASNTMGWQWTAGCGADAAPYFRVFNPILQGLKFDPNGDYVRRWVPEIAKLPTSWIHKPWEAPPLVLSQAGITLGQTYPHPVVDHGEARDKALAAYKSRTTDSPVTSI